MYIPKLKIIFLYFRMNRFIIKLSIKVCVNLQKSTDVYSNIRLNCVKTGANRNEGWLLYTAHITQDGKEQSVREHLDGVAVLCEQFGAKIGLPHTAKLIGNIHDMGKTTEEFNTYIHYSAAHPEDKAEKGKIDHSTAGARFVFDKYSTGGTLDKITAQIVALTVASHHGGLMDCIDLHGRAVFLERMNKEVKNLEEAEAVYNKECFPFETLEQEFSAAKREILAVIQKIKSAELPVAYSLHLVIKYLFSCLVDADRYDTYCFMAGKPEKGLVDYKTLWNVLSAKLEKAVAAMPKDTDLNIKRGKISAQCFASAKRPAGIYRLNVPTGGGKTLSSLRFALNHAKQWNKARIFYIIPFTTVIDQNAKDIKNILQDDAAILEHHSNVVRDNDLEEYTLLTERWDTPIIFTTSVQFLNTLFAGGTQAVRRMHNLADSVLIFDEIQALPLKCVSMFNMALNFLCSVCSTTAILCTATQPLLGEAETPLRYSENMDIIPVQQAADKAFQRVKVVDKRIPGGYSSEDLAGFALEKLQILRSVLVVLNTKKTAEKVYNALSERNKELCENEQYAVFHLSTSMCPAHRLKVLDKLKQLLKSGKKVICVSTQLIEAGINISTECVIRALAGLDSIAQAAGRCNRHGEVPVREAYIVNIQDEAVGMLPDIQTGQDCTKIVLEEYRMDPEKFDYDLLSQKSIQEYYRHYFYERRNIMDYNLPQKEYPGVNMYDLLSSNHYANQVYQDLTKRQSALALNQSFSSAGKIFKVIDQDTTCVLVPYGEGERLIEKINGDCPLDELKRCLRHAQQYSVNLFSRDMEILQKSGGVYALHNGGVFALQPDFYDEEVGVSPYGGKMLFCNY